MATWTVNTTTLSGSVDSTNKIGALKAILSSSSFSSGDTIVFDDSLEDESGVITIVFDEALVTPKNFIIDGGEHWTDNNGELKTRVVFDCQNTNRAFFLSSSSAHSYTLKNITFYNGKGVSVSGQLSVNGGAIYTTSAVSISLDFCAFLNCTATTNTNSYGGGAFLGGASSTVSNCLFKGCFGYGGGGLMFAASTTGTLFNSTFINNTATGSVAGGFSVSNNATATVENCTFTNNTAGTYGASAHFTNQSITTVKNCTFTSSGTNGEINIGYASTSVTFEGTNTATSIRFIDGASATVKGVFNTGGVILVGGATITLDGTDVIFAVTSGTPDLSGATFQATTDSTGYLALPIGTTPPTVGANIVVGEYGANVQSVGASISENVATLSIVAQNTDKTYVVEGSSDGGTTWTPLTLVDKKTTLASSKAYIFRTFDGSFVYSDVVPRVYYYKGAPTAGSFAAASDWALDEGRTIVCSDAPTIKNGTFYCV